MKNILKYIGIAGLVAIGCVLFAEIFSMVINGLDRDIARIMGVGLYICMTFVVCTGTRENPILKDTYPFGYYYQALPADYRFLDSDGNIL